jgi:hypothetical protein
VRVCFRAKFIHQCHLFSLKQVVVDLIVDRLKEIESTLHQSNGKSSGPKSVEFGHEREDVLHKLATAKSPHSLRDFALTDEHSLERFFSRNDETSMTRTFKPRQSSFDELLTQFDLHVHQAVDID